MKYSTFICSIFLVPAIAQAQLGPEVTSWLINTTGETGYAGIPSNVQEVQYSSDYVYVSSTCIPGYDIGPWTGNPNVPANQDFTFKITRHPQPNTGTATATTLGHIGIWINGVSLFNAKDAMSYNNQNTWHQDAVRVEGPSFDLCLGHPAPNGEYHLHLNPTCLYDDGDNSLHSPVIGYAFDGYPIYGCFGFADTMGGGGITRMKSSYRLRSISTRTTYPDGSSVSAGPVVSTQYPLGYYVEDYEYIAGLGDLDEHNGRFCVTPEYPQGTYAYFVTIDSIAQGVYPYIIGPTYYGIVTAGNTGPQSGHNVPAEPVTTYLPVTGIESSQTVELTVYPNPVQDMININSNEEIGSVGVSTMEGRRLAAKTVNGMQCSVSFTDCPPGIYLVEITTGKQRIVKRVVKQ